MHRLFPFLQLTVVSSLFVTLSSCINYGYTGSGVLRTEIRDVSAFQSIAVYDGIEFVYTLNQTRPRHEVKVTLDDNLIRFVNAQVVNGRLDLRVMQALNPRQSVKVEISGPPLSGFSLSNKSRGTADTLTNLRQCSFDLSGGAQLSVNQLQSDNASVQVSTGAALTFLSGTVGNVNAKVFNNAKFNSEGMKSGRMELNVNQWSQARVNVLNFLNVTLNDNSNVYYKGIPQIQQQILSNNSRLTPINE